MSALWRICLTLTEQSLASVRNCCVCFLQELRGPWVSVNAGLLGMLGTRVPHKLVLPLGGKRQVRCLVIMAILAKHQMSLVSACGTAKPVMFAVCGLAHMLTAGGGGGSLMPDLRHPPSRKDSLGLQYCSIAAMHNMPPASSQTNLK